jgi:hypothetical protein
MSSAFAEVLQIGVRNIAGAADRGKVIEPRFSSLRMWFVALKARNRMGRDYPQLCWGSTAWLRVDLMPLIAAWSSN